jgi:hypothetical protein
VVLLRGLFEEWASRSGSESPGCGT